MTRRYRFVAGLLLSFGLLMSGCGGPKKVLVTGVVTLDGHPLDGASVGFMPNDPNGRGASCATDQKGEFEFVPIEPHNVLAPGAYTVTFSKYSEKLSPKMEKIAKDAPDALKMTMSGGMNIGKKTDVVPPEYRDKDRSKFKVNLKEGMNKLPPFELTGSKGAKSR